MTIYNHITLAMLFIVVTIAMVENRKIQVAGVGLVYALLAVLITLEILGVE